MRFLLFVSGFLLAGLAFAESGFSTVAVVDADTQTLDLTPYVQILKDTDRILDIEQVRLTDATLPFRDLVDTGSSLGFDDSLYWLKFTLSSSATVKEKLVLHFGFPVVDHISLFAPNRSGRIEEQQIGELHPVSEREIPFRNPVFKLEQDPGTTITYYMKVQTGGALQIPLTVMTLTALAEYIDTSNLAYGFYYGVMLILFGAALVAFYYMRHQLYLSYAVYLLSFMFFQLALNGFGYQYLWPGAGDFINNINSAAMALVVVCGLWFAGTFLKIWTEHPALKQLYLLVIGIGGTTFLVALVAYADQTLRVAAALGLVFVPIVMASAIVSLRAGFQPARFFLAAWGVFLVGVLITCLNYFGILENNFVTYNAMQIASLLEILILGYVLLDNVTTLHFERRAAMQANSHLLNKLNRELETEVVARTCELEEKNRMLSDLALRDSMTGLLNHNASMEQLRLLLSNAKRYRQQLSVLMIDIDFFKRVNDHYGHQAGDVVIQRIAAVLESSVREADSCGRYGGEEFVLLLPQTSGENASGLAESIREKVQELKIPDIANESVSISVGVTELDLTKASDDPLRKADKALYAAKMNGRNRVVFLQDDGFEGVTNFGAPDPDAVC